MKHGTLSNEVQGRFVVIWDGLLATLPDDGARRKFVVYDRTRRQKRALRQWQTDPIACAALTDMAYRRHIPVDIVTLLPEVYVPWLRKRIVEDALPVTNVTAHTEDSLDELARHTPYLLGIIHPFVGRYFLFGSKGLPVSPGRAWNIL